MDFTIQLYVDDDKSSDKPLLVPWASMNKSTTSKIVSLTCPFSSLFAKTNTMPNSEDKHSQYFSLKSLREAIPFLQYFSIFLLLVVDSIIVLLMRVPSRVLKSRHPERFCQPIPVLVMTSQHVQTLPSITTTVDLEYALLVFSTNHHDPIDPNCSIHNYIFETKMICDCPLVVVNESVAKMYTIINQSSFLPNIPI